MKRIYTAWLLILFGSLGLSQTQAQETTRNRVYIKLKPIAPAQGRSLAPAQGLAGYPLLIDLLNFYGAKPPQQAFPIKSRHLEGLYRTELIPGSAREKLLSELRALPSILYAETEPVYHLVDTPNDFTNYALYHLDSIRAREAWELTRGSDSVVIAIIDNAIMSSHEDLAPNIWVNPGEIPDNGMDDDQNGYIDDVSGYDVASMDNDPHPAAGFIFHGTHVAGCASAATNNEVGVASIGYNCKLLPVKAATGNDTISNSLDGIAYAIATGADIINMSFGSGQFSRVALDLIRAGVEKGCIFVGGGGNSNTDAAFYPASYEEVVSVGFTNSENRRDAFSNFGPNIDVMAPGFRVWSTATSDNGGIYAPNSGSSMASPIVAGVIGLMKSVNPCLTQYQAEAIIEATAQDIDRYNPGFEGRLGAGLIDAQAAVALAVPRVPEAGFDFEALDACGGVARLRPDSAALISSCSFRWVIRGEGGFLVESTSTRPWVTFPESGVYEIELQAISDVGQAISKREVPVNILPSPSVDVGRDTSACVGDSLLLEGKISGEFSRFDWFPNRDLLEAEGLSPILVAQNSANYQLIVRNEFGCEVRDTLTVRVAPRPTTLAIGEATISLGDTVQLRAFGARNYLWSPDSSLTDATLANPRAFPSETTWYTVVGSNDLGCSRSDSLQVVVNTVTDLAETLEGQAALIFPNPAEEQMIFEWETAQPVRHRIELYALTGARLMPIYQSLGEELQLSFRWKLPKNLAKGMYWVSWVAGEQRILKKIQIL